MLYDCFPFFNELDLLELRLETMDEIADYFVLVEGTKTHSNKDKPLYFFANQDRFQKWLPRIKYLCVRDWPEHTSSWVYENVQRNAIAQVLQAEHLHENDMVLVGDADEIPNPDAIAPYINRPGMYRLLMSHHGGFLNCRLATWLSPYMIHYAGFSHFLDKMDFPDMPYAPAICNSGTTATRLRMLKDNPEIPLIENAGWHFTHLGGAAAIEYKYRSGVFADEPHIKPLFEQKSLDAVIQENARRTGAQHLDIAPDQFERIDERYPKPVQQNPLKWSSYIHSAPYLTKEYS